jgi:hypothetical protein
VRRPEVYPGWSAASSFDGLLYRSGARASKSVLNHVHIQTRPSSRIASATWTVFPIFLLPSLGGVQPGFHVSPQQECADSACDAFDRRLCREGVPS